MVDGIITDGDAVFTLGNAGKELEEALAAQLRTLGIQPPLADGLDRDFPVQEFGIRVRVRDDCWVYLARMITNWRIVQVIPELATDDPYYPNWMWYRAWCYDGTLPHHAVLAALTWSGELGTEPQGWRKEAGTERRSED